MKKRTFLLVPIAILLLFGLFALPVKGASVTDPEGDLIGVHQWTDGEGNPKIDCDWDPSSIVNVSSIDIKSIEWMESGGGVNYTVTMTFFGLPNATLISMGRIAASIFFIVNGSTFPDELDSETPDAALTIISSGGGTVLGNETTIPETGVMTVSGDSIYWEFNKSLAFNPVSLDNWDVLAAVMYQYSVDVNTYTALDHYNFDYLEDVLTLVCSLINLQIPGYSLIAVGVVAVITIGVIIKKKYKK